MAYTAAVLDSKIDVSDIRDLLVQGDAAFPTINFTLPAGFTGLTWRVRGTFMQFNLATQSGELAVTGSTTISIAWPVGSNFTTYYGEMQIVLVGTDALGNIVTKATGYVNVQRDFSISTVEVVDENLFEQLMAELSSSSLMLDQTDEQEMTGGVLKLAADRVISDDHHIVDKKHVADVVATVTADDFNHNDTANKQGGSAGEYYHTTQAQNAALHAHANKAALDNVTGTNTGDQAASSFDHNDLANKQGGTTNEYYHVTAAEKTVISNTSGTNTGDQDVSGAISTHNTDAGAHGGAFALHYTFRWDKVNALGARLNSLANIGTNIASYCHLGTLNTTRSNPFDSIYPWSGRNICNISIDAYRALTSGASLRDCIISWLGDPDFDYAHANGAWVYTPEFWYKVWDEGGYRYFDISPVAIVGYIHELEKIEGRWHGGTYTLIVDGTSKSCLLPKPGMPGKSTAFSTLHTYAKNFNASVENIYGYSATNVLMIVEFATMNMQTAIGNGVSDLYRQSGYTIKANATASATVKILTADASTFCIPGAIFDIGTSDGSANVGSFIIASTAPDADPTYTNVTLTTDGTTPAIVSVTTLHYWSVHGLANIANSDIGRNSGYVGTNGRCHAYYRGQEAHANIFRYILGAYRQTGTGKIWIANNPTEADAYDALNTAVHKDTSFVLPQGAGGASTGGYIDSLHLCADTPAAPFCKTVGGSSANPVGDYCYVPALSEINTVLLAGGSAAYGAPCGRFCGYWLSSAATSHWLCGAVPVLKSPCVKGG